jgi:hypothetical protein
VDLLTIWQTIWRRRWVALPVLLLTVVVAGWAVLLRPPVYESSATLLLLQPPGPPTPTQLQRDPALAGLNADNPYTRVYDPAVLIAVVADVVGSEPARRGLAGQGADDRYVITNTVRYGLSSPLVEITGTAATPAQATRTTGLVATAFAQQLRQLQAAEHVSPRYFVMVRMVDGPAAGRPRASDKVRVLVGVFGLGLIGLFSVISVADALGTMRARRRAYRSGRHRPAAPGPAPAGAPATSLNGLSPAGPAPATDRGGWSP